MTRSTVAYTAESDSSKAGTLLGKEIFASLGGEPPDALIVFASSRHDYSALLKGINEACRPKALVGCSSAGEFISGSQGEGSVSAVALRSDDMRFAPALGTHLSQNRAMAAKQITSSFRGLRNHKHLYKSALILTDALAGYVDDLIEQINTETGASYGLFGGGAGDDAKFSKTHVFFGTEAYTDAAVALEILSSKPLGIGVRHGWQPSGTPQRVTEVDGARVVSLNAIPAVEAFAEHAEKTGQHFDPANPLPFFLHNVLGVDTGGGYKLRVPLSVGEDGSVTCAADIPAGSTVRIMSTSSLSAADAAASAIKDALTQIGSNRPGLALFFDCVATRLRMGKEFGLEMDAMRDALGTAKYAGCNTYGQIARVEGQFSGFHNCTATVCVFPA
jgi:hypothetical protein